MYVTQTIADVPHYELATRHDLHTRNERPPVEFDITHSLASDLPLLMRPLNYELRHYITLSTSTSLTSCPTIASSRRNGHAILAPVEGPGR